MTARPLPNDDEGGWPLLRSRNSERVAARSLAAQLCLMVAGIVLFVLAIEAGVWIALWLSGRV